MKERPTPILNFGLFLAPPPFTLHYPILHEGTTKSWTILPLTSQSRALHIKGKQDLD